jgi:hypothetical protein
VPKPSELANMAAREQRDLVLGPLAEALGWSNAEGDSWLPPRIDSKNQPSRGTWFFLRCIDDDSTRLATQLWPAGRVGVCSFDPRDRLIVFISSLRWAFRCFSFTTGFTTARPCAGGVSILLLFALLGRGAIVPPPIYTIPSSTTRIHPSADAVQLLSEAWKIYGRRGGPQ